MPRTERDLAVCDVLPVVLFLSTALIEWRRKVVDDQRPINGTLLREWVRVGNVRWEVVRRSWSVFTGNTTELLDLLKVPATNMAAALQLMGDDVGANESFWGASRPAAPQPARQRC